MMIESDGINKRFELAAYGAIIILCVVGSTALVKRFILPPPAPAPRVSQHAAPAGSRVAIDHDWSQSSKTLVLVLSENCHFCSESAPFYRSLITRFSDRHKLQFVAVFPQDVATATKHLSTLGVSLDEVKQSPLSALGVNGTPTLILVDNVGRVIDSWLGRLSSEDESKVINRIETQLLPGNFKREPLTFSLRMRELLRRSNAQQKEQT